MPKLCNFDWRAGPNVVFWAPDDCICRWVKPCAFAWFVVEVELEVLVRYVHTLARQCVVNRHVVDMQIACHM